MAAMFLNLCCEASRATGGPCPSMFFLTPPRLGQRINHGGSRRDAPKSGPAGLNLASSRMLPAVKGSRALTVALTSVTGNSRFDSIAQHFRIGAEEAASVLVRCADRSVRPV